MIGSVLNPFQKTQKRKPVSTAKFYFFDIGVSHALSGYKHIMPKTELYEKALEHLVFLDLKAYLKYKRDDRPLTYWRARNGYEVDFIIGDNTAIEVKATEMVTEKHLKSILALTEEIDFKNRIIISEDTSPRQIGKVLVLPIKDFLIQLWEGRF